MLARLAAFIVWALVAACVVYWSLKLLVRSPGAPTHSVAAVGATAVQGDLTRLLGASPVASAAVSLAPEAASRFRLYGVMAPKRKPAPKSSGQASTRGVALISIDGGPAKAYAVGARVDNNLVLQSVSLRSAVIGPAEGGASLNLEVPPLPQPATGTLASLGAPVPLIPTAPLDLAPPRLALPMAAPPRPAGVAVPGPVARPPHGVVPRYDASRSP
ncbi:MAG: hypothetical protein WA210_07560 [Burkholderiaceae bacterium]